jgi:hypothetical protein
VYHFATSADTESGQVDLAGCPFHADGSLTNVAGHYDLQGRLV